MLKLSPEAKVGLFVILGVILLVYMSLKIGEIRLGNGNGNVFTVRFDSVAGLDVDAPVRIAGVEVGRVNDIVLENFKARLVLRIHPNAIIRKDFTALIKTQGLLGERYVELIPGSPDAFPLESGGELTRTTSYTAPDILVDQLSNIANDVQLLSKSVSNVLGGNKGEATLRNIVNNLEQITLSLRKTTVSLNEMISENKDKLSIITANVADFSEVLINKGPMIVDDLGAVTSMLNQILGENKKDFKTTLANIKVASSKLKDTLDSIDSFTKRIEPKFEETLGSVQSIADKIDRGEGSIGRLVNEEVTIETLNNALTDVRNYIGKIERFRTFAGYRTEFLVESEEAKSFFSLTFQPPSPEKYYFLEIVDNPRDRILFEEHGGIEPFDDVSYSAQVARRFNALTVRGGLLESTGGVGIDYSLVDNRIRFTFEASDFDSKRDPRLKVAATYNLNRYFFITGGYDDFISRQGLDTLFFGMGVRFEDADLRDIIVNLR